MLEGVITWSLRHRMMVIILAIILVAIGARAAVNLPIDAFPDTTPVQVQINTFAPALSPAEIEQQITFPIEQAIGGLPSLAEVRSISKFGLSQITVLFEDGTDLYFARQVVSERLQTVGLPEGIDPPEMGPVSTGLGEIFHYIVSGDGKSLEELTTLHDWVIKPRLRSVRGIAEVNTWGGLRKQFHVLVDPTRLIKFDLTMDELFEALQRNNMNVGGGNIAQAGELRLVHGVALTTDLRQIGDIVIAAHNGVPIRVRDVATVELGHEIRRGASTADGKGEIVSDIRWPLEFPARPPCPRASASRRSMPAPSSLNTSSRPSRSTCSKARCSSSPCSSSSLAISAPGSSSPRQFRFPCSLPLTPCSASASPAA